MGNRKLRQEANQALKELGYGRLYVRGKKRQALRYLNASNLRRIIFMANLRKGDLVNDCDGFNHRLAENPKAYSFVKSGVPDFGQLVFADGMLSCGCPWGPDRPWTPQHILQYHSMTDEEIAHRKESGWWTDRSQKLIDRIRSGLPITDDDGIKIELE